MTQTVISQNTPWCSPAQLAQLHDWRPLARLCVDDDSAPMPTLAQFLANANVALILQRASGDVESALLVGDRYSVADLQALGGTNAGVQLVALVADLAVWYVYGRRNKENDAPAAAKDAKEELDLLREGVRIFGFQESADAGRLGMATQTRADADQVRGIVRTAEPYWGRRARDYNPNAG